MQGILGRAAVMPICNAADDGVVRLPMPILGSSKHQEEIFLKFTSNNNRFLKGHIFFSVTFEKHIAQHRFWCKFIE